MPQPSGRGRLIRGLELSVKNFDPRASLLSLEESLKRNGYDNCEIRTHALSEYDLNVPP